MAKFRPRDSQDVEAIRFPLNANPETLRRVVRWLDDHGSGSKLVGDTVAGVFKFQLEYVSAWNGFVRGTIEFGDYLVKTSDTVSVMDSLTFQRKYLEVFDESDPAPAPTPAPPLHIFTVTPGTCPRSV